jgi:lathosterol oxidase
MGRTLSPRIVAGVEVAVVTALTSAGLLARQGWRVWYAALFEGFALIAIPVLGGAAVVTWMCERQAVRLQGPRRGPALLARGTRDTALAAWVAACLLAWPLARMRAGEPTGLVWTVAQAGGPLALVLQNLGGILVLDAWLYWKHRLLHTRLLFGFHRPHHGYRDPTPLAGFAVGTVESLLTFWPVVILALPQAPHYGPVYFTLVVGFVLLNLYLHCGVVWHGLEAVLRPLSINTSTHHNRHHANSELHYAEALTIWDRLLRT